jgi:hypothetical protein
MDITDICHKYVSVYKDVMDRGLQSEAVKQIEGKMGKDYCCCVVERYVGRRQ